MKTNRIVLSAALLASTAMVPVSAAWAQDAETAPEEDREVITVRYQYVPDDKRVTSEVSSFLDVDDIAITGDSDIASALGRVTGLSISDGRFVIVRGLNERYSNTLINGSPMASPEPFRRAVPLDLLPTGLISNVLVQKTYSPQFPGEFGGGLIEIETSSLPNEGFIEFSLSASANTATSFDDGLTYDGGDEDWLGFDDGTREWPSRYVDIFETQNIGASEQDPITLAEIGRALPNAQLWLLQTDDLIPANGGGSITMGDRYDVGDYSFGVLAAAGYDNDWDTRIGRRGKARVNGDVITPRTDFARTSTTNTIEMNGLLGLGVETGNHSLNSLAMVLRSTDKEAQILEGRNDDRDANVRRDSTNWFERQVYTYQVAGDHVFEVGEGLELDWRYSFSDASREAPNNREAVYEDENDASTPGPDYRLLNGIDGNSITFTRVDEETSDIGFDVILPVDFAGMVWEWKLGYSQTEKERTAYSRNFGFEGSIPDGLQGSRIDYIFADQNILDSRFRLRETGGVLTPEAYRGELNVEAVYIATDVELTPFLRASGGVRFEDGEQIVDTFGFPNFDGSDIGDNEGFISEDYVLPAATLTWTFADNLQARFGYSETIVRPQFRELGFATFFNTETDERFTGNPFLVNSEIQNFDARVEYYFGREQFITAGVFHKQIENPIVEYVLREGETLATSFINAPEATLTGFEFEFERTFDFSNRFEGEFWDDAEFFVKTNYTYISSEMSASATDTVILAQSSAGDPVVSPASAAGFIEDGQSLQGQSEHLANLQIGWEDVNAGTRTALLVNYTGERSRALANRLSATSLLPEVIEQPPIMVDLVHSRSYELEDGNFFDVRVAVRNILDEDYEATQSSGSSSLVVDSYKIGTTFSINLSRSF